MQGIKRRTKPAIDRSGGSIRTPSRPFCLAALLLALLAWQHLPAETSPVNPLLRDQAPGTWIQLENRCELRPTSIHSHAGLAVDPDQSVVYVFGSDTHNTYWNNDVWSFDLVSQCWKHSYAPDKPDSYRYQAGFRSTTAGRPWAMHVFGMIAWDPINQELLIGSQILHYGLERLPHVSVPEGGGEAWWRYSPAKNAWTAIPAAPPLGLGALCYHPRLQTVLGIRGDQRQVVEWNPRAGKFGRNATLREAPPTNRLPRGYTLKAVYDSKRDRVLLLSWDPSANLWVLDPKKRSWVNLDTANTPPGNVYGTWEYDASRDAVVALYPEDPAGGFENPGAVGQTWICDLETNGWRKATAEVHPPYRGLSYQMTYDPRHEVIVYIDRDVVWSYKTPDSRSRDTGRGAAP